MLNRAFHSVAVPLTMKCETMQLTVITSHSNLLWQAQLPQRKACI